MEDTLAMDNNHVGWIAFSSVVPCALLMISSHSTDITSRLLHGGGTWEKSK